MCTDAEDHFQQGRLRLHGKIEVRLGTTGEEGLQDSTCEPTALTIGFALRACPTSLGSQRDCNACASLGRACMSPPLAPPVKNVRGLDALASDKNSAT